MIEQKISKQILTIGMGYENHRGGIGAVLETYAANIDQFKFIAVQEVVSRMQEECVFVRNSKSLLVEKKR